MSKIYKTSIIKSSYLDKKTRIKKTIEYANSLKIAKEILKNYTHESFFKDEIPVTYIIEEHNICSSHDDIYISKNNNRIFLYNERKELGYSTELMKEPILDLEYDFKHNVGDLVFFLDPLDLEQLKIGIILSQPPSKKDLKDFRYKKEDISYILISKNHIGNLEPVSIWGNLISNKNVHSVFKEEEIKDFHKKILDNNYSIPLSLKDRDQKIKIILSKVQKYKFIKNIKIK